ncbi:Hypothetical predicted protein [Cloeon dipterum]|uniref:Uncharacterized protein n=1 Tax=Cloeon dipterum TaxID=197152 RepID=A0A8S1CIC7_9INSE|nr:Hypothetical predicted protein [Cloeon dipterum]
MIKRSIVPCAQSQSNFSSINCLKLWIKMEQVVSSSNDTENGLNLQPALSPDENFANSIKILFGSSKDTTIEQKKQILANRCSEITKFNFAEVMALFPEDNNLIITDILITIASNAKNMSDFQIIDESATRQKLTVRSMSEEMVCAIAKMTKLKILKIQHYFSISFSLLMELCGMLPSLKKLFFKIEAEPNFAISNLNVFQKCFGHLEIFQFCPFSNEKRLEADFRESLTLECIRYLPNLILLGDPEYFVDMLPTCLYYESLANTDQSKLKYLALRVDQKIPKNALSKFPGVELMHINWVEKNQPHLGYDVPELLEFEHLSVLIMSDLGSKYSIYIKKFLMVYGKQLTRLILLFPQS